MNILERDGLSAGLLAELSYKSNLGISLKKNLEHFDKAALLQEVNEACDVLGTRVLLRDLPVDYRVKSYQSAALKYQRYFPGHQARKVFNDLLGFRSMCDSYTDVLELKGALSFRVADLSTGKASDDGYRGVHVYYQASSQHYPIEIQYNTFYDRQLNNWLHKYLYKRVVDGEVGARLRTFYEGGYIRNEEEFKGRLEDVLSGC